MTGRTDVFINEIKNNLEDNVLKFWIDKMQDPSGGFYGQMTGDSEIIADAPKGAIQNARVLWAFSAAYSALKKNEYLMVATRAKDYFLEHFIDNKFGGIYWSLNADGTRLNTRKHSYALGLGIYALSEYVKATKDDNVLKYAINIYETLEKENSDLINGGYVEAKSRDWSETSDNKLKEYDIEASKTMRTHLHILEAYTNLYRVWPNEILRKKISMILDLFTDKIVDRETGHLNLFFDEKWNKIESHTSNGFDIQTSWIILDAAFSIKDIDKINKVRMISQNLSKVALEGIEIDGSMVNCPHNKNRDWWVQAETVVGGLWMWKYLNIKTGADIATNCWNYISTNLVDDENGEWYWSAGEDGKVIKDKDKVNFWKSAYYNARMCLAVLEMFK